MENSSADTLYFPQKLKLNKEIIKGLGLKELGEAVTTTLALNVANVVIYFFKQDVFFAATYFFIAAAIGYGLFAKIDDTNVSFVDQLHFMLRRMKSPNHYRYHYLDEWELD